MEGKRLSSLDVLRGLAVVFILLFHSSIFNFANIHKLDFSNPPILIVLMSFMALWGGIFIIYSSAVNAYMLLRHDSVGRKPGEARYLFIAGAIYLVFHYLLNIFLGRWSIDFVNNQPELTAVAGTLRNMRFTMPGVNKWFEGSSLSTIGMNLIVLAGLAPLLLRNKAAGRQGMNYWILGLSGTLVMLLSFTRVYIYPMFERAMAESDYLASTFFSFAIANPYPLLPYIAYGLIGMMVGMMAYEGRWRLLAQVGLPLGLAFFVYGIIGMLNLEKSISKPDFFWYFKTNFELGAFILMLLFALLILGRGLRLARGFNLLKWFSRASLTIYMLETTTSELLRMIGLKVFPGWNETINGCLLFGAANIALWAFLLALWQKADFKYGIEYFWVLLFRRLGKPSTKLEGLGS
ncbi:MAG TPA: hypothetical protein PKJ05_04285 [Bacillota bacterium]|nr:hypothetical protein [Bacillota bacterium]HOA15530.1 hypothetical protein [Bacillota bacterium]